MPKKAILFDFMGTCLDWHSAITSTLPPQIPLSIRSNFALTWRHAYFDYNTARQANNEPPEDIDITHRKVLDQLLSSPTQEFESIAPFFTEDVKQKCIKAWHCQPAWPDVAPALQSLRDKGYELYVHANGTPRLQLDLCRFSGLRFDMLFSSKLLGVYKPAPEAYLKCLELLKLGVDECVMVAAHASDVKGAKGVGMKTVYIYRWTDDVNEDQDVVKKENDAWLEGMEGLVGVIDGF